MVVKVLFIDDAWQKVTLEALERRLMGEYKNLDFEGTNSNLEALNKLKTRHYDIIFYDRGMEVGIGDYVSRQIKELSPGCILIGVSAAGIHNREGCEIFDDSAESYDLFHPFVPRFPIILKKYGFEV